MKKVMLILLLLPVIALTSCSFLLPEDEVFQSIGEYVKEEKGVDAVGRDMTVYTKYYYDDVDLAGNDYFECITEENAAVLGDYIDDFEEWVACVEDTDSFCFYDFSRENVDEQDYLCLRDESDPGVDKEDYTIYFFDSQTNVLYYFRNTW